MSLNIEFSAISCHIPEKWGTHSDTDERIETTLRRFQYYLRGYRVLPVCLFIFIFGYSSVRAATITASSCSGTTAFPLGAYVGDPNNADPSLQASFLTNLSGFEAALNATPKFLDTYTNYYDPISHWVAQNAWQAASFSSTPQLAATLPVIGLPLASLLDNADADYRAFAAGQNDNMLKQLVLTWVQYGYRAQYWRLGWEMNLYDNPLYGGDMGTQEQTDWISAFRHVYAVMHAAGLQYGANVQIIWNPGITSYSPAGSAVNNFYPGNSYVDIIGVDMYGDLYPFSLYDFTSGLYDSSLAQWKTNPVNLEHYYNYPAGNQWSNDASLGHSTTMLDMIKLAKTAGKPLGIVETGAGNSTGGLDLQDNPTFPQWLAQVLSTAQSSSVKIAFVNIWDANAGGNYEFSFASDNKPLEKAAWSKYFGGQNGVCTKS